MRAKLREIAQESGADPKGSLFRAVAHALPKIQLGHNKVMVATYIQPERTIGGVFLPDRSLEEDRFQSKVGLILLKGPLAFVDDAVNKFMGFNPKIGDWVWYSASDGKERFLADEDGQGTPCRVLDDTHIEGVIESPELVW